MPNRGVWLCEHCDETIGGEDRVVEAMQSVVPEPGGQPMDEAGYFIEAHWDSSPHEGWREFDRGRLSDLV